MKTFVPNSLVLFKSVHAVLTCPYLKVTLHQNLIVSRNNELYTSREKIQTFDEFKCFSFISQHAHKNYMMKNAF